jgi:superfamily II DNA or RNA helicase
MSRLTRFGLIVPEAGFDADKNKELLDGLKYEHKPRIGQVVKENLVKKLTTREGVVWVFPRGVAERVTRQFKTDLTIGSKLEGLEYTGEYLDNQKLIADFVFRYFSVPHPRGLIMNMPTGLGKTFTAAAIIAQLKLKTLIIVPTKSIQKAFIGVLENLMKYRRDNGEISERGPQIVQWIPGKSKETEPGDITVMIINSAIKKGSEFFKNYGLVVIDEVHLTAAPQNRTLYTKIESYYILGMTATLKSSKDAEIYVKSYIGRTLNVEGMTGYVPPKKVFSGYVQVVKYFGPDSHTQMVRNETTGLPQVQKIIEQFRNDPYRNDLIISQIRLLHDNGKHTFVFSESREHLEKLSSRLSIVNPEITQFILYGGVERLPDGPIPRVIFTTYSYSSVGLSIPEMNSLILATPRASNHIQITGRIMRISGDNSIGRVIVDIVDANTILKHQFRARQGVYEFRNFDTQTQSVRWNQVEEIVARNPEVE